MDNNKINTISALKKGTFGVEITTATEPKMKKTGNPFIGRVTKISVYYNAILGVSYENAVNGRLEKKGLERDYVSEAPRGKKWYNAFFYVSEKDSSVYYLKIGMRKNTTCRSHYLVDGRPITESELAMLNEFLYKPSGTCNKQAEHGLEEDEQYRIVAPKLENVVEIKVGNTVIS